MKRKLSIIYFLILVLSLGELLFGQHITGSGTAGSPYVLYDARDLDSIRFIGKDAAKYYKLGNDIDFTGITGVGADTLYGGDEYWQPIVDCAFDLAGDGYSIIGVKVDPVFDQTSGTQSCIFGGDNNFSIHNVVFEQCSVITQTGVSGSQFMYIGILGKVEGITISLDTLIFKNNYIEANYGTKINSYHYVGVIASGYANDNWNYIGSENNTIIASGSTNSSIYIIVGGLMGSYGTGIYGNVITKCYSKNNYIEAANTYSATVGVRVGGLFGTYNGTGGYINNCYALNNTLVYQDKNDSKVGGFSGLAQKGSASGIRTSYCYTRMLTSGTTVNAEVGSYFGESGNTGTVENYLSYTDTSTTGYPPIDVYLNGSRDTTNTPHSIDSIQLKTQSTFVGWDFVNNWTIDPAVNDGYPELIWALPTFAIVTPTFGDTYNPSDSLFLTWLGADTVKFYYSVDAGSNWIFKDTVDGYSYYWDWLSDHVAGSDVRCLITNLDSSLTAQTLSFTCNPIFSLTVPIGGEVYEHGDTIDIQYSSSLDSTKFYLSTDAGSTWTYLGQDTASGSFLYPSPDIYCIQARVMITSTDSAYVDESLNSFFILPEDSYINIVSPTETAQTTTTTSLLIQVETVNITYFKLAYSLDATNFTYIDSLPVSAGDGSYPDTTNYYWNTTNIPINGAITIKAYVPGDSLFVGSITDPYYGTGDYQYVGLRGASTFAQAVNQWSSLYLYDDNLYTVSFFGFVWGWYDYSDRIDLWKWNQTTDQFEVVATKKTPGAAFYPYIHLYRSSPFTFVMWNRQTGTSGYYRSIYKTSTITYPNTISDWTGYIDGVAPTSIDTGNTVINYNGWQYRLNQVERTISAYDLNNPGNAILVTDASVGGIVAVNNVDFYVYDDWIIISRRFYEREFGTAKVWIVGNAFPENNPTISDQVTFWMQGTSRNFFRGIYPNAIIEYFPPIR